MPNKEGLKKKEISIVKKRKESLEDELNKIKKYQEEIK